MSTSKPVTELLARWRGGDAAALENLLPLVYDELHRLARHYLASERPDHTLQSTALVHEAYLRLVDQSPLLIESRAHFFGIAARLMRQILVDHARARRASKRDAGCLITFDESAQASDKNEVDLIALDDALNQLSQLNDQQARIVELRFFTGLSINETAAALGVSPATVKRDWAVARAWLYRELARSATL